MPKSTTGLASWTDSDLSAVEWSKRKLRLIFATGNHDGRDNAISAKQLARSLQVNDSTVRDLVQQLRAEGLPIASVNGRGYYVITSDAEFDNEIVGIEETIATLKARKRALRKAWRGDDDG